MIYSITGHTSGIGKAMMELFTSRGHVVHGFSRSNGFDIIENKDVIVKSAESSDVFINNAFCDMGQVELLRSLFDLWKNQQKTIVNISTDVAHFAKSSGDYNVCKLALDEEIERLQRLRLRCRIINIRPGYVDTPRIAHRDYKKLSSQYVADVVAWTIDQPNFIQNLSLVVNPS